MEFLGTHRGAALYKVLVDDESLYGKVIEEKVRAEAIHPGQKNLKVDFEAEGINQKEALKNLIKKIDKYLDKHGLDEFDFSQLDEK
ncbi:hypothetical protein [Fodinibius salsisoli]|uniref:Uncharacterized protein n=1 Tax=Fodinibius salsisoli TaxID=2820877 RepID=A0ABT3PLC5_9BACT|nr:hypothetical protein [Fodinibius salsisoli]MCW9706558.1 hypothetical protein [Fodinibius salsisoli]